MQVSFLRVRICSYIFGKPLESASLARSRGCALTSHSGPMRTACFFSPSYPTRRSRATRFTRLFPSNPPHSHSRPWSIFPDERHFPDVVLVRLLPSYGYGARLAPPLTDLTGQSCNLGSGGHGRCGEQQLLDNGDTHPDATTG